MNGDENKVTHEIATAIAGELDGWRYQPEKRRGGDNYILPTAKITNGTLVICVHRKGYGADAGKLRIWGELPYRTARGEYDSPYGHKAPEIGASSKRTPKAIAADVKRRLLPSLESAHAEMVEHLAQINARDVRVADTVAKMLAAGRGRVGRDDNCFDVYMRDIEGWCSGLVHCDTDVTLELRSLSSDLALEIAELIAKRNAQANKD